MDTQELYSRFLDAFQTPAFIVQNGTIICGNKIMETIPIEYGTPIKPLLGPCKDAYKRMPTLSRLCLTVTINKVPYNASVVRTTNYDLFHLESRSPDPALEALTKAAVNFRRPLSEAMLSAEQMEGPNGQALRRNLYQLHRSTCIMSDAGAYAHRHRPMLSLHNIKELISKIVNDSRSVLDKSGIKLDFHCKGADVIGAVDKEKLERAVLNMICNAVRNNNSAFPITVKLTCTKLRIKLAVQYTTGISGISYKQMLEAAQYTTDFGANESLPHLDMIIIRGVAFAHKGTLLLSYPPENKACMTLEFPVSNKRKNLLRSNVLYPVDYAGGYDHILTELADVLTADVF